MGAQQVHNISLYILCNLLRCKSPFRAITLCSFPWPPFIDATAKGHCGVNLRLDNQRVNDPEHECASRQHRDRVAQILDIWRDRFNVRLNLPSVGSKHT